MSDRKMGFDRATLGDRVVEETDDILVMPAVIARELVQEYPEGRAYKPAEELEKAAWTAEGRWVAVMQHPETGLITRRNDVKGRIEGAEFVKDIVDPKTKRPMVRGIRANVKWFKKDIPNQILDDVKSGALRDVSIGFTYEEDRTPGEWEGQAYDFAQRNIFIDHVVAPCPAGRCPSPYCGIGVDSILEGGKKDMEKTTEGDCPICGEIERLGLVEASKRLAEAFGSDVLDALSDAGTGAQEKAKQEQEARSKKYSIAVKEGGNVTKPAEYASIPDDEFADPVNYRYPIDAKHVQAAWSYINQPDNQKAGEYSSEEWAKMKDKVKAAMKKHGHQVQDEAEQATSNPPTPTATPPEEETPDVRDLIARTEELLGIWRKLGEKSASFT